MVSIHTLEENNFLADLTNNSTAQFWTGGISQRWLDGSAWQYDNWAVGEPVSLHSGCVVYSSQTREWSVQSCGDKRDFVCKKHCPLGWRLYQEHCYKYVDEPRSWEQARTDCLSYQVCIEVSQRDLNSFIVRLILPPSTHGKRILSSAN